MEEYNSPCISCCKTDDLFSLFEAHSCEGEEIDPGVDLLYQCFDIQLMSNCSFDAICGSCLLKLRDTFLFKSQVLKNTQDLQLQSEYINAEIKNEDKQETIEKIINPETGILEIVSNTELIQTNKIITSILRKSDNELDKNKGDAILKITRNKKEKKVKRVSFLEPEVSSVREIPKLIVEEMDSDIDINIEEDIQPIVKDECKIVIESPKSNFNENNDSVTAPSHTSNCKLCNQNFKSPLFLQKHMATHTFDGKCDKCGKTFTSKVAKTKHMISHLEGPFPCKYCDQIFEKMNSRNAHMWRTHKTDTPYVCKECGDRFKTFHKRLKHLQETHGRTDPQYPCPHCDKKFFHAGYRWQHIRLSHYFERRHTCTECPMKFSKRRELLSHLATIHDIGQKRFECHVCFKTFFRSTTLKYHLKTHEKAANLPFKCNQCDIAFAYKELLKCHIKRHEMASELTESLSEVNALFSPVEDIVVVDEKILDDSNDTVYLEFLEE